MPDPQPIIERDCEAIHGFPQCMGCAARGPHACTCTTLTEDDHAECVRRAHQAARDRNGRMCHDCAFRRGSPEEDEISRIAKRDIPFHCHQGMPIDGKGKEPEPGNYVPNTNANGEPDEYPVCAGWLRANRRYRKQQQQGLPIPEQEAERHQRYDFPVQPEQVSPAFICGSVR